MVAISFQEQFVAPIYIGLDLPIPPMAGVKIAAGLPLHPKRHTIRAYSKRRPPRPGETLQLYYAQRSPKGFKIADARCTLVQRIMVWPADLVIMLDGKLQTARQIQRLARADGFAGAEEMRTFMMHYHRGVDKFAGVLIHWEAIKPP